MQFQADSAIAAGIIKSGVYKLNLQLVYFHLSQGPAFSSHSFLNRGIREKINWIFAEIRPSALRSQYHLGRVDSGIVFISGRDRGYWYFAERDHESQDKTGKNTGHWRDNRFEGKSILDYKDHIAVGAGEKESGKWD